MTLRLNISWIKLKIAVQFQRKFIKQQSSETMWKSVLTADTETVYIIVYHQKRAVINTQWHFTSAETLRRKVNILCVFWWPQFTTWRRTCYICFVCLDIFMSHSLSGRHTVFALSVCWFVQNFNFAHKFWAFVESNLIAGICM